MLLNEYKQNIFSLDTNYLLNFYFCWVDWSESLSKKNQAKTVANMVAANQLYQMQAYFNPGAVIGANTPNFNIIELLFQFQQPAFHNYCFAFIDFQSIFFN